MWGSSTISNHFKLLQTAASQLQILPEFFIIIILFFIIIIILFLF